MCVCVHACVCVCVCTFIALTSSHAPSTQMGEHAQTSHTTISVLGIEGSTCAMEALSSCASITNGTVNILHPLEMVRQIRLISQNPVIATEVEVTYFMDQAVQLDKKSNSKHITRVTEHLGNVTRETDVSTTFSVDNPRLKNTSTLPFQVMLTTQLHILFICVLIHTLLCVCGCRFKFVIVARMVPSGCVSSPRPSK